MTGFQLITSKNRRLNISYVEIFIKKRQERMTTTLGDGLRTSVFRKNMLTNIDGDKSPNFCGSFHNYMICNYFCDRAGLRDMLCIQK